MVLIMSMMSMSTFQLVISKKRRFFQHERFEYYKCGGYYHAREQRNVRTSDSIEVHIFSCVSFQFKGNQSNYFFYVYLQNNRRQKRLQKSLCSQPEIIICNVIVLADINRKCSPFTEDSYDSFE